jgi:pyruvate/2-oxoglutarate dehydrogenase complex dihydrolipoamide acyltransferase (E2) component
MDFQSVKLTPFRKLSRLGFDMIAGSHNFMALLEFDVTEARKALRRERREGKNASFFAFMVGSIAKVLGENGDLNAVMGKGRIYRFRDVDVDIPIEIEVNGETRPGQYVIRGANGKTASRITAEIDAAREQLRQTGFDREDRRMEKLAALVRWVPQWLLRLILKRGIDDPLTVRKHSGTTFVTSVSMFNNAPGFIVPYAGGPKAVSFAIGGIVKKPAVVRGQVAVREILSITIVFNHDIIDGAPAARFISRLRREIEGLQSLK